MKWAHKEWLTCPPLSIRHIEYLHHILIETTRGDDLLLPSLIEHHRTVQTNSWRGHVWQRLPLCGVRVVEEGRPIVIDPRDEGTGVPAGDEQVTLFESGRTVVVQPEWHGWEIPKSLPITRECCGLGSLLIRPRITWPVDEWTEAVITTVHYDLGYVADRAGQAIVLGLVHNPRDCPGVGLCGVVISSKGSLNRWYFNFTRVVAVALVIGIIFQSFGISFPKSATANVWELACFQNNMIVCGEFYFIFQLAISERGLASAVQPLRRGAEVLEAFRNWRPAVKGEKGDIVQIVGYASSAENHEQLLLPRNRGENAEHH